MADIILKLSKKDWSLKIEGDGYTGGQCVTDIDELQRILNAQTTSQKPKVELARTGTTARIRQ